MAILTPTTPAYAVNPLPEQGTVQVLVTTTANAGSEGRQFVEVQRSSDGVTWEYLRWGRGYESDGTTVEVYDDEAPTLVPLKYRVRSLQEQAQTNAPSAWNQSRPPVTLRTIGWYLSAPMAPSYRLKLVVPFADRRTSRAQPKSETDVAGREHPFVQFGTRRGRSGQLTFQTETNSDWELLNLMLDMQSTLYLQAPNGECYYISPGDLEDTLVARISWVNEPVRACSLSFAEVGAP